MTSHHRSLGLSLGGALLLVACSSSLDDPETDSGRPPFGSPPSSPPLQNASTPAPTPPAPASNEQPRVPSAPPAPPPAGEWQAPATIDPNSPVEPEGAYLENPGKALSHLRTVVRNAIDLGVYVLIDWHDHHAHLNEARAIEFFSQISREFGQFPHVLYETFNEPEQVDWSTEIKPYHEAVVPAIRAQDPDNVIILGTRQWSQRVDEAAADPVTGTNLMYTVHFYACDHRDQQRSEAETAYAAGLALFVTEWGATPADGGASNPTVCADDAQAWHDWMNERNIGWTAWKLDGCADSSCLFNSDSAPADGGWTDQWLNGHARFVVERLLD
jgi:hypothetical protein